MNYIMNLRSMLNVLMYLHDVLDEVDEIVMSLLDLSSR